MKCYVSGGGSHNPSTAREESRDSPLSLVPSPLDAPPLRGLLEEDPTTLDLVSMAMVRPVPAAYLRRGEVESDGEGWDAAILTDPARNPAT